MSAVHTGPGPAEPVRLYGPLASPGSAGSLAAAPVEGDTVPLAHYVWLVQRNQTPVTAIVLATSLLAFAVAWRLDPVYEATATVEVDRQMLGAGLGTESAALAPLDAEQHLATQIRLAQSDSVVRPVALRHGLQERERPGEVPSPAAPVVLKRLRIHRPPGTQLLEISYRSNDPDLAAKVANGVAESYIDHSYQTRLRASAAQSRFLSAQLADLEQRMRQSGEALARAGRQLQLISPEEKGSILAARLLRLNEEFAAAQAVRVREEAAWRSIAGGLPQAAEGAASGESLRRLGDHTREVEERFAEIEAQYGPNHPEHRKAARRLAELRRQRETLAAATAARVETAFREAAARERMLGEAVAAAKRELDQLQSDGFAYRSLQRAAEADRQLYDDLVRKVREASLNANLSAAGLRLTDPARPPAKPVGPPVGWITAGAALSSFLFALLGVLVRDAADRSVRDPEQVERTWGVPVLGALPVVPRWRRVPGLLAERPLADLAQYSYAESLRSLRRLMLLIDEGPRRRSLLVTSPAAGEGKSTIAAQLAATSAAEGRRTLLIDGDLRKPSLHGRFGLAAGDGLGAVIAGTAAWRQALLSPPGMANLSILTAGRPGQVPPDRAAGAIAGILAEAAGEFDWIVIDAPPLLGFPEPLELATLVDGVLVAARAGQTPHGQLGAVLTLLGRVRAPLMGVVLNQVHQGLSPSYAHYGPARREYLAVAGR